MAICTKCNIDKPIEQYDRYWHSTQNTFRTRRYCKACYKKQKDEYKLKKKLEENPSLIYENNPDYTQCKVCTEWKHKDEYYQIRGKINYAMCKSCCTNKDRAERQEYLKENCGSDFVHREPNKFTDEYQKSCVFGIMQELGYLYDNNTGIWVKPGVKEIVDGKAVFLNIKKKNKYRKQRVNHITTGHIKQVLKLRKEGTRMIDIIEQVGISENSIYKILKLYGDKAY